MAVVSIPGLGNVSFPDSMSADEVNAASKRLHDQHVGNAPMEGFMARHGETDANAEDKFRSMMNVPLNNKGVAQAKEAAESLKGKGITHVVTSPMSRAMQTAHIHAKTLGVPMTVDPRLKPWDLGGLAGKDKKQNASVLEDLVKNPDTKPAPGKYGEGESLNHFEKRNQGAVRDILSRGGKPLIIAHTSNMVSAGHLAGSKQKTEIESAVKPGGAVKLSHANGKTTMDIVHGHEAKPKFGVS